MFAARKAMLGAGYKGPKFVGASAAFSAAAVTSLSVPAPANADGDLLLAAGHGQTGALTTLPAHTALRNETIGAGGVLSCYKMAASEPASRTLTGNGAQRLLASRYAFRNAVISASSNQFTSALQTATALNLPSINAAKGLLLALIMFPPDGTVRTVTAWPDGYEKLAELAPTGAGGSIALLAKKASAGATGRQDFTITKGAVAVGMLISLTKA